MPSRLDELALDGDSKPPNLSDKTIEKLYDTDFSPVDFLNSTLPALSLPGHTSAGKSGRLPQLQDVALEVQSLLSKLNTHNIRTSSQLTQITDEILRSGSRLAYEVEILRGDINSLYRTIAETLREDINQFVQENPIASTHTPGTETQGGNEGGLLDMKNQTTALPPFIEQLQTLQTAKSRLEQTIKTFDAAMRWPLPPPPSPTLPASIISVSAPEFELGLTGATSSLYDTATYQTGQNARGQDESKTRAAAAKSLRDEVTNLLDSDRDPYAGLEAAARRVEELRQLTGVWRGTSEEKPRTKFVDSLQKIVDDRKKVLDTQGPGNRPARAEPGDTTSITTTAQRSSSMPGRPARTESPARGLLRNLQKLRDEIYLE